MKRNALFGGGAVVLTALVIAIAALAGGGGKKESGAPKTTGSSYKVVAACDALALPDAEAILGEGTRAGSTNGQSDSESSDVAVSTCSYSGIAGETVQETKTITLLSRSAKSAAGATSNELVFGQQRPAGKQGVGGVGDAAFWDAEMSQLHVLVGKNWYIMGNMSGANANSGNLDVSRAVYERIKSKL